MQISWNLCTFLKVTIFIIITNSFQIRWHSPTKACFKAPRVSATICLFLNVFQDYYIHLICEVWVPTPWLALCWWKGDADGNVTVHFPPEKYLKDWGREMNGTKVITQGHKCDRQGKQDTIGTQRHMAKSLFLLNFNYADRKINILIISLAK